MKKSILNLGAQELTKKEQKNVNGGLIKCHDVANSTCPANMCCSNGTCIFPTPQKPCYRTPPFGGEL